MIQKIENYAVLSFDTSKNRTGWAFMKGYKVLNFGTIEPPKEFSNITYMDSKWPLFLKWYMRSVFTIAKRCNVRSKISFAVLEDLHIQHRVSAKVLQEVQAAAKLGFAMFSEEIPLNPIHNSTAKASMGLAALRKKHFTPKQNLIAKEFRQKPIKIAIIESVNRIYKTKLKYNQDDEADAILLAHCMMKDIETFLKEA